MEEDENDAAETGANAAVQVDPAQIKTIIDTSNDMNVIFSAVQNCRKVTLVNLK